MQLPAKIFVQHLRAKNDRNGNPRRIFQVYDANLEYIGWVDEGYEGTNFCKGRHVHWLSDVYVGSIRDHKIGVEWPNKAAD